MKTALQFTAEEPTMATDTLTAGGGISERAGGGRARAFSRVALHHRVSLEDAIWSGQLLWGDYTA